MSFACIWIVLIINKFLRVVIDLVLLTDLFSFFLIISRASDKYIRVLVFLNTGCTKYVCGKTARYRYSLFEVSSGLVHPVSNPDWPVLWVMSTVTLLCISLSLVLEEPNKSARTLKCCTCVRRSANYWTSPRQSRPRVQCCTTFSTKITNFLSLWLKFACGFFLNNIESIRKQ